MALPARKLVSYEDYLDAEHVSLVRHEYADGEVFAMAGGTPRHSGIKTNLAVAFGVPLSGRPCRPYDSDLRIRIPDSNVSTYPDLSVVCGPPENDGIDRNAVTNPVLVVEVLSRSTESWDRGTKFWHYRRLPSLRHYVLVAQDPNYIEHFSKDDDGTWRMVEVGPGGFLVLADLGLRIAFDDVYRDLPPALEEDRLAREDPTRR